MVAVIDCQLSHPTFAGAEKRLPLRSGQSALAPFQQDDFMKSMLSGEYSCTYNLLQLSAAFTLCTGELVSRHEAWHSKYETHDNVALDILF